MEALLALWKKLVLSLLVLVALLVGAAVQAVVGWRAVLFGPSARALTGRSFEATPERIERGAQRPAEVGAAHAATFVQVMRTGKLGTLSPTMPWVVFSPMSDEDLGAVFAYLRTLKPVAHVVVNSAAPTRCRVCGLEHGGGDRNGG